MAEFLNNSSIETALAQCGCERGIDMCAVHGIVSFSLQPYLRPLGALTVSGANHYHAVWLGGLLRNQSVGDVLNGSAIPVKRLEYLFRLSLLGTVMGH